MLEMVLDNILVQPDKPEGEKVINGIIMPGSVSDVVTRGTVIAVGDGTYQSGVWIKTHIKVGDRVLFRQMTGFEIEDDGTKFLVFKEPDLIAVIK